MSAWLSIDGVDGVGKTALSQELSRRLDAYVVAEFSPGPVGRFLLESVQVNPHLISASEFGQSLVFLGEFWERYEELILPALRFESLVVTDRGYLSKAVYQQVVIGRVHGDDVARRVVEAIMEPMARPSRTVLLTADMDSLHSRVRGRGETSDAARESFWRLAQRAMQTFGPDVGHRIEIDTSSLSVSEVADQVLDRLVQLDVDARDDR